MDRENRRRPEGDGGDLDRIAEAISDKTPIDWADVSQSHPELIRELAGLRLLERIAEVHRTPLDVTPGPARAFEPGRPVRFLWGSLRVLDLIGEGSSATVWRAFDPNLQRDVALKLLREELTARPVTVQRFLDEARRMARVRHPNVLTIHGADRHGGQAGFWADLVEGATLEARLRNGGPFGSGEAAVVGIELCRALAAVHAAGLVHGDVKASNVMRDGQGRIVLMDFGAGSERVETSEAASPIFGTPLSLAPEALAGAAPGPATDLYALGVLLYRLVSGAYPVPASTMAELEEKHRRGEQVPLLDRRPDLPAEFVGLVDRSIAPDPTLRPRSAGEVEAGLARFLASSGSTPNRPESPRRPRRNIALRWIAITLGLAVAVGAVLIGTRQNNARDAESPSIPSVLGTPAERELKSPRPAGSAGLSAAGPIAPALAVEAALCRSHGGAKELLVPGALVRPGDALFLELHASQTIHLYVLIEEAGGNIVVLFPHAELDLRNPLEAGVWHRLPGSREGIAHDWEMGGGPGKEGFLVLASREPSDNLEETLAGLSTADASKPAHAAAGIPERSGTRGITGTVKVDPAAQGESDSRLSRLARALADEAADPGGLWTRHFVVFNAGS